MQERQQSVSCIIFISLKAIKIIQMENLPQFSVLGLLFKERFFLNLHLQIVY